MDVRVVTGRERVVRELRAAAPLMARLAAPIPARAPWLTAVLNVAAATRRRGCPVAVVVESGPAPWREPPDGAAFLWARRRGAVVELTMLGADAGPLPSGRPASRLLARDEQVAARLADGILALAQGWPGSWRLRLTGLPMGDPTLAALGERRPDLAFTNVRSTWTADRLDELGLPVRRSRDPREVERLLPVFLAAAADRRARSLLGAAARLHAAADQVEVAEVPDGPGRRAALLTLVDGADRWPWVSWGDPIAPAALLGAPSTAVRGSGGFRLRPAAR